MSKNCYEIGLLRRIPRRNWMFEEVTVVEVVTIDDVSLYIGHTTSATPSTM